LYSKFQKTFGSLKPGLKKPKNLSGISNVSPAASSPPKRRLALFWRALAEIRQSGISVAGKNPSCDVLCLAERLHGSW